MYLLVFNHINTKIFVPLYKADGTIIMCPENWITAYRHERLEQALDYETSGEEFS